MVHSAGAQVRMDWMEIEGPTLNLVVGHLQLNGVCCQRKMSPPEAGARNILARFMNAHSAVQFPLPCWITVSVTKNRLRRSFIALRTETGLLFALASPRFLYLQEPNGGSSARQLDAFEVASRLSYFLWRTMPDAELYGLAKSGDLLKPSVLGK